MKKIIFAILFAVLGVNANAQYTASVPAISDNAWHSYALPYYTAGDDTATNSDVIRMGIITNLKYDVNIKLVATKVSGTLSATAYVRTSPDGTNWNTICQGETKTYKDSLSVGDATTTQVWSFTADELNGKYVEVYYVTTGTSVSAPVTTLYYRKPEQ